MKKTFLFLVSITFLISCNNKEKYQGKWSYFYSNNIVNSTYDTPSHITIENDSIKFNYPYFDHGHKFPLRIKNKNLIFNNWNIHSNVIEDTLLLNHLNFHIPSFNDSLYSLWGEHKIRINLPQVQGIKFDSQFTNDYRIFLYFGKRIDNNKYSLLLNDSYGDYNDLPRFLYVGCGGEREESTPFVTTYLFFDKDSKMKEIEQIFTTMSRLKSQKLKLINDIKLKFNDSMGIHYNYESIIKTLHPFQVNEKYYGSIMNQPLPPPPPTSYSFFHDFKPQTKFILLKKDKIYFKNKIVNPVDLKNLIKPWIKENNILFSLYDLGSTYGSFLEMNAIINSAYEEVREAYSKIKFNKSLKKITREEMNEIKMKIRMYHIWSHSIPHYNSVIKQEKSFLGLKVNKKM